MQLLSRGSATTVRARRKGNPEPHRPRSSHRREHERRVNRNMDCVQAHLSEDLTLDKLAAVAALSPFHFHRVFASITGETSSGGVRAVRCELRLPGRPSPLLSSPASLGSCRRSTATEEP